MHSLSLIFTCRAFRPISEQIWTEHWQFYIPWNVYQLPIEMHGLLISYILNTGGNSLVFHLRSRAASRVHHVDFAAGGSETRDRNRLSLPN